MKEEKRRGGRKGGVKTTIETAGNRPVLSSPAHRALWFPFQSDLGRRVSELWTAYFRVRSIQFRTVSDSALEDAFFSIFEQRPVVSFRLPIPKALNAEGESILRLSKLWVLWAYVMQIHREASLEEVLKVLEKGREVARPVYILATEIRKCKGKMEAETESADLSELSTIWSALSLSSPDQTILDIPVFSPLSS